jgi:hypothetical protein
MGFDLNSSMYKIFKLYCSTIGKLGIRQMSKRLWKNLSKINLGKLKIMKVTTKSETQVLNG